MAQKKFSNKYDIVDNIVTIYIKRRTGELLKTIIDLKNLSKLQKLNSSWHVQWDKKLQGYYVRTCIYLGTINRKPKYKSLLLHSFLMGAKEGEYIDHINHDTLDNRENNLKLGKQQKNTINRKGANKNNISGYRNVSYYDNLFLVQLQIDGKNKLFGKFETLEEANICAVEMRNRYYNEKL